MGFVKHIPQPDDAEPGWTGPGAEVRTIMQRDTEYLSIAHAMLQEELWRRGRLYVHEEVSLHTMEEVAEMDDNNLLFALITVQQEAEKRGLPEKYPKFFGNPGDAATE